MKMTLNIRNYFTATRDFLLQPYGGNTSSQTEGRLDFIDGLRGVTMILVVYWHVLVMSLNVTTYTAMTLQLFRMPLFFFISGFFAYSFSFDRSKLKKRLSNRWHRQLLPTAFIFIGFILFEVAYMGNFNGIGEFLGAFFNSAIKNASSEFKSGYWFTFVLVEVFCIFALINYLLSSSKISRGRQGIIFLALAAICGLAEWGFSQAVTPKSPATVKGICELFSLTHLMKYQVFFYLGAAARCYDTRIWSFLSRRGIGIMVALMTFLVFWYTPRFRVPLWLFYVAACTGILFSITLFLYLRRFFNGHQAIGRLLKYIGKNTLPIYLFHYFIIRLLHDLDLPWLVGGIKAGAWAEIPIVTFRSMGIVLTVLGVDALLKIKPRIHKIIFAC